MTSIQPLESTALRKLCDPAQFEFETTAELEDLAGVVGQSRAIDAIRFGINIRNPGYNIYALGPTGVGKHAAVNQLLEEQARTGPVPSDWCYVNNFKQPAKPDLLQLPAGRGAILRDDMDQLVKELRVSIPAAFENRDYLAQLHQIEEALEQQEAEAFQQLHRDAENHDIKLSQRPGHFTFVPMYKGQAVSPEEFDKLPEEEGNRIGEQVSALQEELQEILEIRIPQWHRESRNRIKQLNERTTISAVAHIIHSLKADYRDLPQVLQYLDHVEEDVIENVDAFRKAPENGEKEQLLPTSGSVFRRYQTNLLVDNSSRSSAPVIYEDRPGFSALIGRIEYLSQLGTLVTDFTQIKPGALHLANGGYLILDAHKLLTQPYAWEGLKRVLLAGEVHIESLAQLLGLVNAVSLEPEPVPLNIKVVLLGDRLLYYLLQEFDPDFPELFKVSADFDTSLERSGETELLYARLIATLARKDELRAFDRSAVAAMIQFSMRLAEDTHKLSMHVRGAADLMQEANYWAGEAGHKTVGAAEIEQAWNTRIKRHSRSRDHLYESIQRDILMIDTVGEEIGQVNGISVIELGDFSYGVPSRITATTRLGEGEMIDIERETELGGPIHSKGVFILSSFLGARYSRNIPLSLAASLAFEQSYSGVEGDSASLAELCALLSALADVPLKQSLGVTGSVNQLGKVQPIGSVNDKIEGFFDICSQRGLSSRQGAIIPAANVEHLMLREDVVEAAQTGLFSIYPVNTVDEALELLTGMTAGETDQQGVFQEGSFNSKVQIRLVELATIRQSFAEASRGHATGNIASPGSSGKA